MSGTRLREFRISMGDEQLRDCEAAGLEPEEVVSVAVAAALSKLRAARAKAEVKTTDEALDEAAATGDEDAEDAALDAADAADAL